MPGKPPAGSVVAGFRLMSLVGEGATGAVYLAEPLDSPERVALKLLSTEFARDTRFRERFLRESEIAASLEHPNAVPILDFGEADGVLYLAMRYIEGGDLRELIAREGTLDPSRTLDLLGQVAAALDEAHARGLVHRDVKPANILVERVGDDEHAYLGDFGLAKHASSANSLTGEHAFVGTIAYVSPEQIRGDEVGAPADVYSLGCVLYECLAGAPPFDRESELAVVYAHLNERTPRLTDLRPELPDGLDDVIRTAMAKDPGDRFGSCRELISAAHRALAGERIRRRRVGLGAALVAALAAAAVLVVVLANGGGHGSAPVARLAVAGDALSLVDGSTRRVAARIPVPERPADVVFDGGTAWALLEGPQQVAEIDVASRKQAGTVRLPFSPGGLAAYRGNVFVTEKGGPGVARVATRSRKVTARWMVPTRGFQVSDPTGIAAGAGSVWLARGAEVVRVDADTGRVQHRFGLPVNATLLTFAGGQLWAASSTNGVVEKIDPATNRIAARVTLHGWVSALAVGGGSVWAAVTPDDVVFRLDGDDASVQQSIPAGDGPESMSAGPDFLWIADARGRALTRIDIRSGARTSLPITGAAELVRQHQDLLWTAAEPQPPAPASAKEGPEIRVGLADSGIELDPAFGPFPPASQLLYSTCAKLVNYPDAAGAAGQQLRPDAAVSMPAISADRRTYTFTIRHGVRFSPPSKEALSAQTFKHTIERALSPKLGPDPAGLHIADDIVGAGAFHAGRAREVRGIVAQGDKLSITLSRPNGDLLSRLAMPIFCAVPTNTPAPGEVRGPLPSAGPYYVRSQTAAQTVLDRNPNYRGTRPRRPARIVYLTGVPTARSVALAGDGRVDVIPSDFDIHSPLILGGVLSRQFPARYHAGAGPGVDMLAFNTRRPLFRDPRLRRAANYAIDRTALARVFAERPTDGYVPPAIPGARQQLVYPLSPDLASARRLMPGRGPRSGSIYVCGDPANRRIAATVRSNLRPLGIRMSIIESVGCLSGPDPKASHADILLITRVTPELDPAPFLDSTVGDTVRFGSGLGPVTWDDAAFRARLERAQALTGQERFAAYARLEEDLLRGEAPYAAYAAFVLPEFYSARTGCRLVQGAYQVVDLGALCVRRS